jgi:hypothetical protein
VFQTRENNGIHEAVYQFLLLSRICKTRKIMKTRGRNSPVIFSIVLSVLQIQENNEYRLVKYEITSQSTIVYYFTSLCFNGLCRL